MTTMNRRELIKATVALLAVPALPAGLANALMRPGGLSQPCPEFSWFGASYPDATCIDGYLWDLDAYEDGMLTSGGDCPCPYCNVSAFLDHHRDSLSEDGWIAFLDGKGPGDNPFLGGSQFPHLTEALAEIWRDGFRSAAVDPEAIAERRLAA